jgi:hypothetical protein
MRRSRVEIFGPSSSLAYSDDDEAERTRWVSFLFVSAVRINIGNLTNWLNSFIGQVGEFARYVNYWGWTV